MSDFDNALKEARRLASTPEGQQLASLLQKMDTGSLQQILDQAAGGDFRQARQVLSALMQDPNARKILDQLGERHGK